MTASAFRPGSYQRVRHATASSHSGTLVALATSEMQRVSREVRVDPPSSSQQAAWVGPPLWPLTWSMSQVPLEGIMV